MVPCVGEALTELHNIILKKEFSADRLLQSMNGVCDHLLSKLPAKKINKKYSDEYLVEVCFNKNEFMAPSEALVFCHISLIVGVKYLRECLTSVTTEYELRGDQALIDASNLLYSYLHDFRPSIEYAVLSREPEYVFFNGSKSSSSRSRDLYWLSSILSQSASIAADNPLLGAHRECGVASVFVLRQAMEVKFERIVGVWLIDKHFNSPRYWHGFHYDFIKEYASNFEFDGFNLSVLRGIYDWCSMVVHSTNVPLAWLLPMAHEYCSGLFSGGSESVNGYWSIHGAVRVKDTEKMQMAFVDYFFRNYDNGLYCVGYLDSESVELSKFQ